MCPDGPCASSSSTGCPGRAPTCSTGRAAPRLKLRQACGRLVRRADDKGVFVMLDGALPSRLAGAFPGGVEPRRVGLAEAIAEVGEFLR